MRELERPIAGSTAHQFTPRAVVVLRGAVSHAASGFRAMVPSGLSPGACDSAVIEAAAAGDRAALECFCRIWLPVVRRLLLRRWRRSPLRALLEDAAQEVMLECMRPGGAIAHFDPKRCPDFAVYLHGIVRNVVARVTRREARYSRWNARAGDAIGGFADRGPEVPDRVVREQFSRVVGDVVDELDAIAVRGGHTLGELVRELFREDKPVRVVAEEWGMRADRVHELRRRACRELRSRLSRGCE